MCVCVYIYMYIYIKNLRRTDNETKTVKPIYN